jgi:hypothetical protein
VFFEVYVLSSLCVRPFPFCQISKETVEYNMTYLFISELF